MNRSHLRLIVSNDESSTTGAARVYGDITGEANYAAELSTASEPYRESLSVDDLYPAADDLASPLQSTLKLLAAVADEFAEAAEAVKGDEVFQADDALIRAGRMLRELFGFRALGDGFGAVINACLQATRRRDDVLTHGQIMQIRGVVLKLRSAPNISFDSATDLVIQMEDAGLNVDPPGFDALVEALAL